MNTRLFLAILAGLLIGAAAGLTLLVPPAETTYGPGTVVTTGQAAIGGPFALTDQTGKPVTDQDFRGRPMLVFFGFTHCPDVCPAGLQVISAALDKLGPKAEKITPLFITLDPERDTVAVMGEYLKSFHPKLVGLTGSVDDIARVAKAYRIYYAKAANGTDPANYTVDHSSFIYLMDASGRYIEHFPHSVAVDKLADAIGKHL